MMLTEFMDYKLNWEFRPACYGNW